MGPIKHVKMEVTWQVQSGTWASFFIRISVSLLITKLHHAVSLLPTASHVYVIPLSTPPTLAHYAVSPRFCPHWDINFYSQDSSIVADDSHKSLPCFWSLELYIPVIPNIFKCFICISKESWITLLLLIGYNCFSVFWLILPYHCLLWTELGPSPTPTNSYTEVPNTS